jgi:hypothetical protein
MNVDQDVPPPHVLIPNDADILVAYAQTSGKENKYFCVRVFEVKGACKSTGPSIQALKGTLDEFCVQI